MIPFRCPHCGLETQVDPKYGGRTGPCAGCGKPVTIPVAVSSLPGVADLRPRRRAWLRWLGRAGVVAFAGLFLTLGGWGVTRLLAPVVQATRQQARQTQCAANLERILAAMQAYHQKHGHLPPAYSQDQDGQPLHSWRVLLLPYLGPEAHSLGLQIHLDEPWDSPYNLGFAAKMPNVFACPEDQAFASGDTSYCVVTGPRYAFHQGQTTRLDQITDGLSNTILVVERAESGINWMAPQDVTATQLSQGLTVTSRGVSGGLHADGAAAVGTADGSVHWLNDATGPDALHALATIAENDISTGIYLTPSR